MALDSDSVGVVDQVAKLRAQVLSLNQQNTDLATKNTQLGEELERTKSELRETQALLGRAVVKASRPQTASDLALAASIRYKLPLASVSGVKRPRSPTMEYVDHLPPPSKKGKERVQSRLGVSSIGKVKESPAKRAKLEFAPTPEVIAIDLSDPPSDTDPEVLPLVAQAVEKDTADLSNYPADDDSDLNDPNVSEQEDVETTTTTAEPEHLNGEAMKDQGQASNSLRRSARFSSTSSFTTVSTLTPVPTIPTVEDKPEVDRKPKREPKQEDVFHLPSSVTSVYLHSTKPFAITPHAITLEIPRAFLRLAYGGSDQQFIQYISAARNPGPSYTVIVNSDGTETQVPKDIRRLVFPMLNANPSMPSSPGAPGLVFASRHEILHDSPWTLFCKRESGKAVWLYLGEYESELVGKLTPEQFKAQSEVVQQRWAELIITQQRQVCYMSMRARIVLRAARLIPVDNKEQEARLINEEVERIKRGNGKKITTGQVLEAFSNGREGVDIIRMKCVKYDHVFANDIIKRFKDYPNMVAAAKADKQKQKRKPARSDHGSTSTARTRHQKRYTPDLSEDDSDGLDKKLSKKGTGKTVTRPNSKSKSKSKSSKIPSTRSSSKSTGTPGSSISGSARSRRRAGAPVIAVVDHISDEGNDNDDTNGADYESEDAFEDDLSESDGAWQPKCSVSSTSARSQSQRARKLSQKVLDSMGPAEH